MAHIADWTCKARVQEVRHANSSMMTREEDKEKVTSDSEHTVRNLNDSLLRNQKPAIAQGMALQEVKIFEQISRRCSF